VDKVLIKMQESQILDSCEQNRLKKRHACSRTKAVKFRSETTSHLQLSSDFRSSADRHITTDPSPQMVSSSYGLHRLDVYSCKNADINCTSEFHCQIINLWYGTAWYLPCMTNLSKNFEVKVENLCSQKMTTKISYLL